MLQVTEIGQVVRREERQAGFQLQLDRSPSRKGAPPKQEREETLKPKALKHVGDSTVPYHPPHHPQSHSFPGFFSGFLLLLLLL